MLKFNCKRRDALQVPILSVDEMDELAMQLVMDYDATLLKEPTPFPYEHFLECYMGVRLDYQDLRDPVDGSEILGLTSFADETAIIFDEETGRPCLLPVKAGTVVLQVALTNGTQEGRLRFTALHEAAHWWCHGGYFDQMEGNKRAVLCRASSVEISANYRRNNSEEWMEYQADYLASAIAMPKKLFTTTAKSTLKSFGIDMQRFQFHKDEDDEWFIKEELPSILAETFGVSKRAAGIKLRQAGIL